MTVSGSYSVFSKRISTIGYTFEKMCAITTFGHLIPIVVKPCALHV